MRNLAVRGGLDLHLWHSALDGHDLIREPLKVSIGTLVQKIAHNRCVCNLHSHVLRVAPVNAPTEVAHKRATRFVSEFSIFYESAYAC